MAWVFVAISLLLKLSIKPLWFLFSPRSAVRNILSPPILQIVVCVFCIIRKVYWPCKWMLEWCRRSSTIQDQSIHSSHYFIPRLLFFLKEKAVPLVNKCILKKKAVWDVLGQNENKKNTICYICDMHRRVAWVTIFQIKFLQSNAKTHPSGPIFRGVHHCQSNRFRCFRGSEFQMFLL